MKAHASELKALSAVADEKTRLCGSKATASSRGALEAALRSGYVAAQRCSVWRARVQELSEVLREEEAVSQLLEATDQLNAALGAWQALTSERLHSALGLDSCGPPSAATTVPRASNMNLLGLNELLGDLTEGDKAGRTSAAANPFASLPGPSPAAASTIVPIAGGQRQPNPFEDLLTPPMSTMTVRTTGHPTLACGNCPPLADAPRHTNGTAAQEASVRRAPSSSGPGDGVRPSSFTPGQSPGWVRQAASSLDLGPQQIEEQPHVYTMPHGCTIGISIAGRNPPRPSEASHWVDFSSRTSASSGDIMASTSGSIDELIARVVQHHCDCGQTKCNKLFESMAQLHQLFGKMKREHSEAMEALKQSHQAEISSIKAQSLQRIKEVLRAQKDPSVPSTTLQNQAVAKQQLHAASYQQVQHGIAVQPQQAAPIFKQTLVLQHPPSSQKQPAAAASSADWML